MSNYVQLFRNGSNEPVDLLELDHEFAKMFDVPTDPTRWVDYWWDFIGHRLSGGEELGSPTMDRYIEELSRPTTKAIYAYLCEHYRSHVWSD